MVAQGGISGSAAAVGWWRALGELHGRVGHRFVRSRARGRVRRYLVGLFGRIERKNGWQPAEAIGEPDPQSVQRLLNPARWDPEEVRDDPREYVVGHLGDEETGALIVDETGFLKKGARRASASPASTRDGRRHGRPPGRGVPGLRLR